MASHLVDGFILFLYLNLFLFYANATLPEPKIDPISYAFEGQDIELTCHAGEESEKSEDKTGFHEPFSLKWIIPKKADNSTARFIIEDIRTNTANQTWEETLKKLTTKLKIQNVTTLDEGGYTCSSMCYYKDHRNFYTIYIKVYSKDETPLVISEIIKVDVDREESAQWVLLSFTDLKVNDTLTWFGPNETDLTELSSDKYVVNIRKKNPYEIVLRIENITVTDTGNYSVIVKNGENRKTIPLQLVVEKEPVIVELKGEPFYKFDVPKNVSCKAFGNPLPKIEWKFERSDQLGVPVDPTSLSYNKTKELGKYMIESTIEFDMKETGILVCYAINILGIGQASIPIRVKNESESLKLFINQSETVVGDNVVLTCEANKFDCGYIFRIRMEMYGDFEAIQDFLNLDRSYSNNYLDITKLTLKNISKKDSGKYICLTSKCTKEKIIDVLDLKTPKITATNLNNTELVVASVPFSLNCSATGVPSPTILWYKDEELISSSHFLYELLNNNQTLNIKILTKNEEGKYRCKAINKGGYKEAYATLKMEDLKPPKITETKLNNTELVITSVPFSLNCSATGVPSPTISWYKDQELISSSQYPYELSNNNQTLNIKMLTKNEEEKYRCKAENKAGFAEAYITLKLKDQFETYILSMLLGVGFLFIICLSSLIFYICRIKQKEKAARIKFNIGAPESINPDLPLEDQTDLLPYDPKWEFPRKKLKYGKQLGAGAFGVVMKAEAFGIVKKNQWTTVAVKMVKRHADPMYVQALASELKIMIYFGKHLNVVNLLGACTKNLYKQKLLVIVEFCTFGNIHQYLLSHRDSFINQIDPNTGEINVDCSDNRHLLSDAYSDETLNSSENSNAPIQNSNIENSKISESCANLEGDYQKGQVEKLTTSTLVCWAFQIARGMEYLASKRVVHGDLAARNVLLTDHNIVKICDFGLAKNIYNNPNYKKSSDYPVPVHWMALECLMDGIYSRQTDVWSYGIVLWELFSLARKPYAEFDDFSKLREKLMEGYRMPCPLYANQYLHHTMLECWSKHPSSRPSFTELSMRLENLLEKNMREHYLELDSIFQRSSSSALENDDYCKLAENTTDSKRYVNTPTCNMRSLDETTLKNSECLEMRCRPFSSEAPEECNREKIEKKPMLTHSVEDGYLVPQPTVISEFSGRN